MLEYHGRRKSPPPQYFANPNNFELQHIYQCIAIRQKRIIAQWTLEMTGYTDTQICIFAMSLTMTDCKGF